MPKKAKEIPGLVPKLHYSKLTDGIFVTLENGRVVLPEEVCEPPSPK